MVNPPTAKQLETGARPMGKILLTVIFVLIVAIVVGVGYFAVTDVPPPAGKIEHPIRVSPR
jgi:hypothetical protein